MATRKKMQQSSEEARHKPFQALQLELQEAGYLEQWRLYTKWLQGTLNHKLFVLELGVGMRFPSVIRWPFEKVAFFNQKAYLCRVHEKLYQLTKELAEKGCGISKNAIDWLGELC